MKALIFGSIEEDVYLPQDLTNEPYSVRWEGEINEAQLLWFLRSYPNCELSSLTSYEKDIPEVIGLTIALNGFEHGD